MAKITKQIVDKDLRTRILSDLFYEELYKREWDFEKINDRQYGIIKTDLNGEKRYCRVGVIVAELREDMTAEELMASEIEEYEMKQKSKEEKAKKKEAKIAQDKAKREEEKKNV